MHLADIAYDHELKSKEKNVSYVKEHFSTFRFYGISAQGADYGELDENSGDELAEKTTLKERAYVYTDKKSFDITEPIDFLIKG